MTVTRIFSLTILAFVLALVGSIRFGGPATAQDQWQKQREANKTKYEETMAQIRADRRAATTKYDDKQYPKGNTDVDSQKRAQSKWDKADRANQGRTESDADFTRRENEAYKEFKCENQRISCEERQARNPNPSAACGDESDRCMGK